MMDQTQLRQACEVLEHPILQHHLTLLRKKETASSDFRRIMGEMGHLIAYELTRNLKTRKESVQTPFEETEAPVLDEDVVIVSILRAGMGLLDGMLKVLPFAQVGHIGIYRDKFIQSTVEYYLRLPKDIEKKKVFLVDPLLATADTAVAAVNRIKQFNVGEIHSVCLLASPQGIERMREYHPDVKIHCVSIERGLDENGYILPGIGDAGDRLYNTR